jgi:hypothetical protein
MSGEASRRGVGFLDSGPAPANIPMHPRFRTILIINSKEVGMTSAARVLNVWHRRAFNRISKPIPSGTYKAKIYSMEPGLVKLWTPCVNVEFEILGLRQIGRHISVVADEPNGFVPGLLRQAAGLHLKVPLEIHYFAGKTINIQIATFRDEYEGWWSQVIGFSKTDHTREDRSRRRIGSASVIPFEPRGSRT